jgi:hypothetical protein
VSAATDLARAASLRARQDKALDKLWRFDGVAETFRAGLTRGKYAYRYENTHTDGTISRGPITHADALQALTDTPAGGYAYYPGQGDPLQGLRFAAHCECPKLVSDYADALPLVRITRDSFEVIPGELPEITADEWAHLTGSSVNA